MDGNGNPVFHAVTSGRGSNFCHVSQVWTCPAFGENTQNVIALWSRQRVGAWQALPRADDRRIPAKSPQAFVNAEQCGAALARR
jgi:hypothetical protein